MNASKAARNAASLVNRPTCGGVKKSGIVPRVGWFLTSNARLVGAPQTMSLNCVPSTTVQTQRTGYRATIGGV